VDSNVPLASAIAAFERGDLGDAREIAEKGVAADGSAQWQHLLGLIHCRAGDAQIAAMGRAAWLLTKSEFPDVL